MNKLPGAVGLGVGMALSSGFFNPAEAHPGPVESVEQIVLPECSMRIAYNAAAQVPGFLCSGEEEQPKEMSVKPAIESVGPDDYRNALIFFGGSLLVCAGIGYGIRREYIKSRQDPGMATAYKQIKKAKEIEVDAEWIMFQEFHSKDQ